MTSPNYRQNRAYLNSLVKQIKEVPRQAALQTAHNLYLKLISYTAVDTGQAALNWRMTPFRTTYDLQPQRMLWGSAPDYENPAYPVLSKNATQKNDLGSLLDYANGLAHYIVQSAPKQIDGVVVYNPITPGFPNFHPGDDRHYESNALSEAEQKWQTAFAEALAEAEANMKAQFAVLR